MRPVSGTVLNAGSNTLSVVFTPTDTVDYNSATNTVTLVVQLAPLSVTASNVSRTFGQTNPVFGGTLIGVTNGDNITATFTSSTTSNSTAETIRSSRLWLIRTIASQIIIRQQTTPR